MSEYYKTMKGHTVKEVALTFVILIDHLYGPVLLNPKCFNTSARHIYKLLSHKKKKTSLF